MSRNKHRAKIGVILGALALGGMLQAIGHRGRLGLVGTREPGAREEAGALLQRSRQQAETTPGRRNRVAIARTGQRARIGSEIDYSRDVKPILSSYCYSCHGPDEDS